MTNDTLDSCGGGFITSRPHTDVTEPLPDEHMRTINRCLGQNGESRDVKFIMAYTLTKDGMLTKYLLTPYYAQTGKISRSDIEDHRAVVQGVDNDYTLLVRIASSGKGLVTAHNHALAVCKYNIHTGDWCTSG